MHIQCSQLLHCAVALASEMLICSLSSKLVAVTSLGVCINIVLVFCMYKMETGAFIRP